MISSHFIAENTSISCCSEEKSFLHQERRQPSGDANFVVPKSKNHNGHLFSTRTRNDDILYQKKYVHLYTSSHWIKGKEKTSNLQEDYPPVLMQQHWISPIVSAGGGGGTSAEERTLPYRTDATSIDELAYFILKRRSTIAPWLVSYNCKDVSSQGQFTSTPHQGTHQVSSVISRRVPVSDKSGIQRWDTGSLNDSPPTIKRLSQVNLQHKSSWVALQDEKRETLRWETGSATALVDCPPVLPKRSCFGGTEEVLA